jgi:hypothetical protein
VNEYSQLWNALVKKKSGAQHDRLEEASCGARPRSRMNTGESYPETRDSVSFEKSICVIKILDCTFTRT